MKITKRQLRRIIKEEKAGLMEYGGRPYDPTRPGDFERYRDNPTGDAPIGGVQDDGGSDPVDDYVAWVEENGHITPSASSVVASYIVEDPKREAYKVMIADAFGLMVSDISHEVKRQQAERAATMGEGKMRVSKRQLRRIIKEEKAKLVSEISAERGASLSRTHMGETITPESVVADLFNLAAKVEALGEDFFSDSDSLADWANEFMSRHNVMQGRG